MLMCVVVVNSRLSILELLLKYETSSEFLKKGFITCHKNKSTHNQVGLQNVTTLNTQHANQQQYYSLINFWQDLTNRVEEKRSRRVKVTCMQGEKVETAMLEGGGGRGVRLGCQINAQMDTQHARRCHRSFDKKR